MQGPRKLTLPGFCETEKNAEKGALIADLRQLNQILPKPLPFRLPYLGQLDSLLSACRHLKINLFFTKLHISNMYRACKLPPKWSNKIRFRVRGESFFVPCPPFGWSHSPVIAIANLARFLVLAHPGQVILIRYLDYIVLVSTDRHVLAWDTDKLVWDLIQAGWKVSPTSVTVPTSSLTWLGKIPDGTRLTIQQSPAYLAQMVAMWIRLACRGYYEKRGRRLVGKVLWAASPSRMVLPFMQGRTVWGPPCSAYTPQRVLRSFGEAMAQCVVPWKAKCPKEPRWMWYVDAARSPVGFLGAV